MGTLAPLEKLEKPLGVLLLLVRRFLENLGDLDVAVVAGLTGEIRVAELGLSGSTTEQRTTNCRVSKTRQAANELIGIT